MRNEFGPEIIGEIFGGEISREKQTNIFNERVSSKAEAFEYIPLSVIDNDDIYDCLFDYFKTIPQPTDDTTYIIQSKITKAPKYLMLQIGRMIDAKTKDKSIKFYPELDISEFASPVVKSTKYELQGIATHIGANGAGHYMVGMHIDKKWVCFSDDSVEQVEITFEDLWSQAYILLYENLEVDSF